MQILVTKKFENWEISPYVKATFENGFLRVEFYQNDLWETVSKVPAKISDSFIIQVFGKEKAPIISKVKIPQKRGEKLLWFLSFCETEKRAKSLEEFLANYQKALRQYGSKQYVLSVKNNAFAILLVQKTTKARETKYNQSPKMKPLLGWISDDIKQDELSELLQTFSLYRKIHYPIDFLRDL